MTGVSVLSITSGTFTELVNRRITSFISAVSSRPTKAVQMSRLLLPSAACSRPTLTQPSQSPASCSSRHFFEPLALQRSPMEKKLLSWRSGVALYRLATEGTQTAVRRAGAGRKPAGARRRSMASSAWMWGTSVPQHPPIRFNPSSSTKRSIQLAIASAPSG
jgi:hypothetical protein